MSLFGNTPNNQPQTGGLFGSTLGSSTQQKPLFGSLGQPAQQTQLQQTGTGLFGSSFGQNNQQTQQQQPQAGGGLFGQNTQQQQQQPTGGLFGQSIQQQQQPTGGLFGQSTGQQQQQNTGGLFGQSIQQPQQQTAGGLFEGGLGSSQINQQKAAQNGGLFGFGSSVPSNQQALGASMGLSDQAKLGTSQLWQQPETPQQRNVIQQVQDLYEKWHWQAPNGVFKHYFYNKVDERAAPYYRPSPEENALKWEEALGKKPGPGYIPVLCSGFAQMGERIKIQQRNLASYNQRLHEINNALDAMLNKHDVVLSVRALEAKRRHQVLKQRCLTLATKVQILRNRGYAMNGDEEDLKIKLEKLERGVCDPGLVARSEEIWARMVGVRERARVLKEEMDKKVAANGDIMDEETARKAEKILEDYAKQLTHLQRELAAIQEEFNQWEKENPPLEERKKTKA